MADFLSGLDRWRVEIRRRVEPLHLPPMREAEIVEEIAQHLDDRYRELRGAGAERAREFGIRVALGAGRSAIIRLVARYALVVSASGILVGIGLSFAGTRFLQSMLYGVTRLEPAVYAAAAFTLVTAVALACVAPVARALRVQPVEVLRSE